jgi:cell fate regulator YaaT (PSP1 superfamily)
MAKEQNLSLNSTKISGCCGRLMCCLRYEHETYEQEIRLTPPVDALVETADGRGTVISNHVIKGTVTVRLEGQEGEAPRTYHRDTVKVIRAKGERGVNKGESAEGKPE